MSKIAANKKEGKMTITLVYYAGHGTMKENKSFIVLPDPTNHLYPLEDELRVLSRMDNSFVVCIFDCCRDTYSDSLTPPIESRGGND